MEHNYVVYKYI